MASSEESLQAANRQTILHLRLSHLLLLISSLLGGWSYPMLQVLIVIELILMSIGTGLVHSERSFLNRVWYAFMGALWPIFIGTVVICGYGAVAHSNDFPEDVIRQFQHLDATNVYWAIAYIALSMSASVWRAVRNDNPVLTWTKSQTAMGYSTLAVMVAMIFISVFVLRPVVMGLRHVGIPVNVDALLITLTVLLRYVMARNLSAGWISATVAIPTPHDPNRNEQTTQGTRLF